MVVVTQKGIMAKKFAILIFLANLLALNCQEEDIAQVLENHHENNNGKPSYSFSYGVSDVHTGDIKAVWETKEGDTVKGHYSVLQPDGTMRSVEYSAGPKTGFTAVVNSENSLPAEQGIAISAAEPKAMRDFEKFYDISEDLYEDDPYERKWNKRPFDRDGYKEKQFPHRKRPKYPFDLEPSDYTHSITIKHPRDDSSESEEAHSHVGYSSDPNCKTKTKIESYENQDNLYSNIVDFELNQPHKYPIFPPEPSRDFDKYASSSNFDFQKIRPYKYSKYEELRPSSSLKHNYPAVPEMPMSDKYYPEDMPPSRPKKKNRPPKVPDYPSDDLDDYILVPKKKYKPMRGVDMNDYRPESDEEYDRPSYSNSYDDHDDRYNPVRGSVMNKEVIRKVVKKRRPLVNLLDIFDI